MNVRLSDCKVNKLADILEANLTSESNSKIFILFENVNLIGCGPFDTQNGRMDFNNLIGSNLRSKLQMSSKTVRMAKKYRIKTA